MLSRLQEISAVSSGKLTHRSQKKRGAKFACGHILFTDIDCLFVSCGQVAASVKPTLVIFVMDGSIGQAAFDQAKAFKDSVEVWAVTI